MATAEEPEISATFLGTLADAATPKQQELAAEINRRLLAGETVEDVRELIERMTTVIAVEQEERQLGPKIGTEEPDAPVVLREEPW